MTNIRATIERLLNETMEEHAGEPLTGIENDAILLETGLDSLGFAILVTKLEDELGYDPFSMSEEAYYPETFGEFVAFYERSRESAAC